MCYSCHCWSGWVSCQELFTSAGQLFVSGARIHQPNRVIFHLSCRLNRLCSPLSLVSRAVGSHQSGAPTQINSTSRKIHKKSTTASVCFWCNCRNKCWNKSSTLFGAIILYAVESESPVFPFHPPCFFVCQHQLRIYPLSNSGCLPLSLLLSSL